MVLDSQLQNPLGLQGQHAPAIRTVYRSLLLSSGDFRCRFPPTRTNTAVLAQRVCRLIMQAPLQRPSRIQFFLHVKAGMTVIVTDTEGAWRMADVIWVDGGARNPKVPTLFQVADVDTGCLLYTSPSPRDGLLSRMPSSA